MIARFLIVLFLFVFPCLARSETIIWTNLYGGNWNTPANWLPNQVPGADDTAVITNEATYTVTLDSSPTVTGLMLGGSSGTQTLVINSRTLTLNGSSTANSNAVVNCINGTITGTGTLSIGGLFSWTGGTLSGGGTTIIEPEGILTIDGAAQKTFSGHAVTNLGTVVWSGTGRIFTQYGCSFYNASGALFEIQNDAAYEEDIWHRGGVFDNAGILRKTGGSGTTTFSGIEFGNPGTVETLSGRLYFPHGVGGSGTYLAASGATNLFKSACFFGEGTLFDGEGKNRLENITATLDGSVTSSNLLLVSGTWQGTNTVGGSWAWTGGTFSGPGSTTVAAGGLLEISGSAQKTLSGRSVTNLGTVVWSGTGRIYTHYESSFYNASGALFEVQNDVGYEEDIWNPGASFHNAGMFHKTGDGGTTTFSGIDFVNSGTVELLSGTLGMAGPFNNDGLVLADAGGLMLSGGGAGTGQIMVATNQTVEVTAGTHTLSGGSGWSGGGIFRIAGAELIVTGNAGVERMEFDSGFLGGSGVLTVTNALDWTGGTMSGGGTTVIEPAALLNISGDVQKTLSGRSVTNLGTVVWSGTGRIFAQYESPFYNASGALFEIQNDAAYEEDIWHRGASFENEGILRKTGGSGTTTFSGIEFGNPGTVETLSGRLYFPHGVSGSGTYLAAGGATNLFKSACFFGDGTLFDGEGENRLESITATVDGSVNSSNLLLVSGTWLGTNTVSGSWAWTGGTFSGPGSTTVEAGGLLEISGDAQKTLSGRSVTNLGTVVWSGTGRIFAQYESPFYNASGALFEVQNDVAYEEDIWHRGGVFDNDGTVVKTGGAGTTAFNGIDFSNTGTVELLSGTLSVAGPFNNDNLVQVTVGTLQLSGGGSSSGQIVVATNQTVELTAGTHFLNSGSTWTGGGSFRISGATVNVDGDAGVEQLELVSGTLGGTGVLTVVNVLDWTGGTMSGGGTTVIEPAALLNISGDAQKTLSGRSVTNLGTVVWSGTGRIFAQYESPFYNASGALFEVQNDVGYEEDIWNPGGTFENAGTFLKTSGTGTTTFNGIDFSNGGTMDMQQGGLNINASFSLDPDSVLRFSLTGDSPEDCGRIQYNEPLQLQGALEVEFLDGFIPSAGDYFDIIDCPYSGAFSTYTSSQIGTNLYVNPLYLEDLVRLAAVGPEGYAFETGVDEQENFTVMLQGIASQWYGVEASTNLVDWELLESTVMPAATVWNFTDQDTALYPHRFYRTVFYP